MRPVAEISLVLVFLVTGVQTHPLVELKSNGHSTDPQCPPPRCLHKSKCYANGEEISRRSDGSGGCHGLLCSYGQSVTWDDFNCLQATTMPATTPAPSTTLGGCLNEGVWYPKGSEISRGSNGHGWCYGKICGDDGLVQSWDDFHCDQTTTEQPITSPAPTRSGCYYDGAWYPLGSYIRNESNGQGWCYGLYCDHHSGITEYDNFKCDPSTTPMPNPTTIPLGCFQNGIWYPPSSDISRGSDGNGWCYGTYCDQNGHVVAWDDWNCGPMTTTETPSSTSSPTPAPVPANPANPTPPGCLQNGISYPPGSEISRNSNGNGWCYGQYCDPNGQVVVWDDWNCGQLAITETPSATPSPSHTPTPSRSTPTPLGCLQNGVWYPAGSEISRGTDGKGWCFGVFCTHDGSLQLWDNFNCKTSPPTTPLTTAPKGCYYEGLWHPIGIFEGTDARGCRYGAQCGLDGQVTRWEEFDCRL